MLSPVDSMTAEDLMKAYTSCRWRAEILGAVAGDDGGDEMPVIQPDADLEIHLSSRSAQMVPKTIARAGFHCHAPHQRAEFAHVVDADLAKTVGYAIQGFLVFFSIALYSATICRP